MVVGLIVGSVTALMPEMVLRQRAWFSIGEARRHGRRVGVLREMARRLRRGGGVGVGVDRNDHSRDCRCPPRPLVPLRHCSRAVPVAAGPSVLHGRRVRVRHRVARAVRVAAVAHGDRHLAGACAGGRRAEGRCRGTDDGAAFRRYLSTRPLPAGRVPLTRRAPLAQVAYYVRLHGTWAFFVPIMVSRGVEGAPEGGRGRARRLRSPSTRAAIPGARAGVRNRGGRHDGRGRRNRRPGGCDGSRTRRPGEGRHHADG